MGASLAKTVKFNSALAVDKQAHFEPSFFAHFWHTLHLLKNVISGVIFAIISVCKA